VVVAVGVLLVGLPLWLLVVAAVKHDSPGPFFYRSTRVGRFGRPFRMYKFRSMVSAAEETGPSVTRSGDPRITRVGRVLRLTKIDEIPQLLNVLRGEMALVGPRPEDPRYVKLYDDHQRRILDFTPGITSPASLEHRHEEAMLAGANDLDRTYRDLVLNEKIRMDLEYFQNRSLFSDWGVLFKTLRWHADVRMRDTHLGSSRCPPPRPRCAGSSALGSTRVLPQGQRSDRVL